MGTILQPQTPSPVLAILAFLLAALAISLLLRIWWVRTRDFRSTMDGPELLLTTAVQRLPKERSDWGMAMTAEFPQFQGRASRWWFALGCAWVALFPPPSNEASIAVVGALASAATLGTSLVAGYVLPELKVFAITFVALVGAFATLVTARSHRPRLTAPGVAVVVGIVGCVATTVFVVVQYPIAAYDPSRVVSVAFPLLLIGYLWLALAPPSALFTHPWAGRLGVLTGVALNLAIALGAPPI